METDYGGFKTTKFDSVVNWSRKFSLFQYPFVKLTYIRTNMEAHSELQQR